MKKGIKKIFFTASFVCSLFLITMVSTQANATVVQAQALPANTVQLACWGSCGGPVNYYPRAHYVYYGPLYYNRSVYWTNWYRIGARCQKRCLVNGYNETIRCVRRCR